MRINSAGSTNINLLQSDQFTFRNQDFVVSQQGAFFRGISLPATANEYSKGQLYNPSGSGITIILDRVVISTDQNGTISVSQSGNSLAGTSVNGVNQLMNGAGGSGDLESLSSAAAFLSGAMQIPIMANEPLQLPFQYPIIIEEEDGFFFRPSAQNRELTAALFWREV